VEGEEGGEAGNCGCVRCTCAAHENGTDVDLGTRLVLTNGIGEGGGVLIANQRCCVGEVVVCAIFPYPYLNLFNGGVASTAVRMSDDSRFEEPDKEGFVCGGRSIEGSMSSGGMAGHEVKESGEWPSSVSTGHVGMWVG
jgi:hypothetical protein